MLDVVGYVALSIPYVLEISLSLAVAIVAIYFFRKNRKSGLMLISVAFFLITIQGVLSLAANLYLFIWMRELRPQEIGWFSLFCSLLWGAFKVAFTALLITGIVKLSRQMS